MVTYTLPEEGGSSLRASGATSHGEAGGGFWIHSGRERANDHPLGTKIRWEWNATPAKRIRIEPEVNNKPDLFMDIQEPQPLLERSTSAAPARSF